jgi:hypothetical protein
MWISGSISGCAAAAYASSPKGVNNSTAAGNTSRNVSRPPGRDENSRLGRCSVKGKEAIRSQGAMIIVFILVLKELQLGIQDGCRSDAWAFVAAE